MHPDPNSRPSAPATLQVAPLDLCHLRYMLQEQIAGDTELLREVEAGLAPRHDGTEVRERLDFAWGLAEQIGGLCPAALPDTA